MTKGSRRRRPQWRGERKAILIRVPLSVANQLSAAAEASSESISDTVGRLITAGLADHEAGSA
ncbi:hypothetical protein FZI91_08090 [Mycobacterium sp. CBMA271]|uniref:hypothetical protein n=1 Tax=unclassified Mycobacteroides TaxID=2618759 RepID=UPI0012DD664D|nr:MULTISPECIES: hypothetical protein [unclassified Mycobacteroides]MUM21665.1 hypothetical protein [Mycobacteroides sp. CBMA 271]